MPANYNTIAPVYDLLSRAVYGNAIIKAQVSLLSYIPANSRVLIVGGGTGWILEKMANQYSSGLIIDYVDASAAMIRLSQKRNYAGNEVNFINLPAEEFNAPGLYDIILTPFFFDNFGAGNAELVFNRLQSLLKPGGFWLYADFAYQGKNGTLWKKLLLNIMYLFFKITCNIGTDELVNMEHYFNSYSKVSEISYYSGFIKAMVWKQR